MIFKVVGAESDRRRKWWQRKCGAEKLWTPL